MATDFSSIEPLNQAANQAENKALASSTAAYTLPDKLRDAISSRFNNSNIVQQRDAALQPALTSTARAREDVAGMVNDGVILSPTQQQSIISAKRASDIIPLISLNDLLQNQFGSIGDLVDAGTRVFQAQVAADQGAATLARERANSALANLIAERELQLKEEAAARASAPNPYEDLLKTLLLSQQSPAASQAYDTSYAGPQMSSEPGTVVQDDETGEVWVAQNDGTWQQPQPEKQNIFQRLFSGIGSLFSGGGAG